MSRAALWRQEASVKERERHANETFQNALEEGQNRPQKGLVPLKDTTTFNLNPMLLGNISKSGYFLKSCHQIKDWTALVDEIYYHVTHLEPWAQGKTPSTAFCLLLRLFTIRCTEKQMKLMLDHVDSPYIRCIGFLYLRYAADPSIIWKWFQPYLYDEEPVKVGANVNSKESTVGEFVRGLLTDLEFYGTRLPRLPISIEREIKVKLSQEEEIEQRAQKHLRDSKVMQYFERVGNRVQAMYGDEENEVAWYSAVVDRVLRKDDETGVEFYRPKFVVTFPEYGNTEVVTLGEMDMPDVRHPPPFRSDGFKNVQGESSFRSCSRPVKHLHYDHVRGDYRSESMYDSKPHSRQRYDYDRRYDDDRSTYRHRSRSRSRDRASTEGRGYRTQPPPTFKQSMEKSSVDDDDDGGATRDNELNHPRGNSNLPRNYNNKGEDDGNKPKAWTKTPEELAAIAEKKRKLLAKYG